MSTKLIAVTMNRNNSDLVIKDALITRSALDADGLRITIVDLHKSLSHDQGVRMYVQIVSTSSITGTSALYMECR